MATETVTGPLGEVRAATLAGGGTALTTTAVRIPLPRGAKQIFLLPRNFATAVVCKFNKNPFLSVLKTTDKLATIANLTDYSDAAQDNDTATDVVLSSLPTAASGGYVYVGAVVPFSGVEVDVDLANSTASVLTAQYLSASGQWTTLAPTDGTTSGGATFAVDGNITWTVPADWVSMPLVQAVPGATVEKDVLAGALFWMRFSVSAALDSTTTLNSLLAINRSTAYAEIPSGFGWEESITVGPGGFYSIQALTDQGTANLIVNCATRAGGRF